MADMFVPPASPSRVKLSRKGGYRMPPNTTKVARPTVFGNPWVVAVVCIELRKDEPNYSYSDVHSLCVEFYRDWLKGELDIPEWREKREALLKKLPSLRGRNVACFCKLDQPCHGDVLLELANAPATRSEAS